MTKKPRKGYIAFEISEESRRKLAEVFPPKFPDFIGHHITYMFGVSELMELPEAHSIQVIGYATDNVGIEALVVSIDGSPKRPDGKVYHITWSLDRSLGYKPVQSNTLISKSWEAIPHKINITAKAKFF